MRYVRAFAIGLYTGIAALWVWIVVIVIAHHSFAIHLALAAELVFTVGFAYGFVRSLRRSRPTTRTP